MSITLTSLHKDPQKEQLAPGIRNLLTLQNDCSDYKYVDMRAFARRLNRILRKPEIQQLYHYTSYAYSVVRRFQLIEDSGFTKWHGKWGWGDEKALWTPECVDSCDWRWDMGAGRKPFFWNYVCHGSCHWMAQANLEVAKLLLPDFDWLILSGPKHTTVAALEERLIYDPQYVALKVSEEAGLKMLFGDNLSTFNEVVVGCEEHPYSCEEGLFGEAKHLIELIENQYPGKEQEALEVLSPMLQGTSPIPDYELDQLKKLKSKKEEALV